MSSTKKEYSHSSGDKFVTERVTTNSQTATKTGHLPYHRLRISHDDGVITNNGTETETIAVEVVDGVQVARGNTPADTLNYTGDVIIEINGAETTKSVTDGSVSFDLTTSKPAGAEITVQAAGLNNHPTDSDAVSIEVLQ
jgi:hypothetical protein